MSRFVARALAASLLLAACSREVRVPEDAALPADSPASPGAPAVAAAAPAARDSAAPPPRAAADSCRLGPALAARRDSSLAAHHYGDYVTLQLALDEVSALAGNVDSAATRRACQAAAAADWNLSTFLQSYRSAVRDNTVLKPEVVRTLGNITDPIDSVASAVPAADSVVTAPPAVEVPGLWMWTLIAVVVLAGAGLGIGLWRLGQAIQASGLRLEEGQKRLQSQQSQFGPDLREKVDASTHALKEVVADAHRTTRTEIGGAFSRVGEAVTRLREQLASGLEGGSGTAGSSRRASDTGIDAYPGEDMLVLDADPFGNAEWEEAMVDVHPASGGAPMIQAANLGMFKLRWVRGSTQARLSVDPSDTLGAAFREKLDAAFRRQGALRGTDHFHTLQDAVCVWDPAAKQGRIVQPGVVQEV